MGKVKIYISGPIAHYDLHERKHAFLMAKERLESQGYDPVNPFDNGVPDNAHWREHMRADIAMLLKCDAIFMLPGWELSKGCKLELDVASSCGIAVIIEPVQPCDYDVNVTMTLKRVEPKRVYCRNCANSSDHRGNSCFCSAKGHRECACNKYGQICKFYKKII